MKGADANLYYLFIATLALMIYEVGNTKNTEKMEVTASFCRSAFFLLFPT